jgi:carboxymethylenebutenolidase
LIAAALAGALARPKHQTSVACARHRGMAMPAYQAEGDVMRQAIIDLYDAYTHERLDRRVFMDRLARMAGGTAAAAALIPMLQANYAKAAIVAPDDARVRAERITFQGATGELEGYLVRPADGQNALPGVIVIHENRGLNPHIEDVARRVALEGFVVLAPDFLSPQGGTPGNEDQAREMIRELDQQETIQNALAAVDFLRNHEASTGKVGVVGFCWGGALANQVAVNSAEVAAVVPFYGRQPASGDVAKIKAPLLLHYAGLDERINAGIPAYEQALKDAGVDYTIFIYEGANHAFHNDTSEARYDPEAAQLAWSRTIDFFERYLAEQS